MMYSASVDGTRAQCLTVYHKSDIIVRGTSAAGERSVPDGRLDAAASRRGAGGRRVTCTCARARVEGSEEGKHVRSFQRSEEYSLFHMVVEMVT